MTLVRAPVNQEVLRWAREEAGLGLGDASKKLGVRQERLTAWEEGTLKPTVGQLRKLADVYWRTPAFFFLRELPEPDLLTVPDYRAPNKQKRMSFELRRQLRECAQRREWLMELEGPGEPSQLLTVPTRDPQQAATYIRQLLGVSIHDQKGSRNNYEMLHLWIDSIENQDILVFQSSRFPIEEARGVSLSYQRLPFILLNGKDAPAGKIFTLLHELFHLMKGDGGLCDYSADIDEKPLCDNAPQHSRNDLRRRGRELVVGERRGHEERLCDRFAAALLMPSEHVEAEQVEKIAATSNVYDTIHWLVKTFKVSELVATIRLCELGFATQADVNEARLRMEAATRGRHRRGGGPPYAATRLRDVGNRYASAVVDAYELNRISLTEVSEFLGTKLRHLPDIEARIRLRV